MHARSPILLSPGARALSAVNVQARRHDVMHRVATGKCATLTRLFCSHESVGCFLHCSRPGRHSSSSIAMIP